MIENIVIPKGMLKAVADDWSTAQMTIEMRCSSVLEAALRWLSENPIVPTQDFLTAMLDRDFFGGDSWTDPQVFKFCEEWQRSMFLEPESEVPEEIIDLLCRGNVDRNPLIIEAYRRGKESK